MKRAIVFIGVEPVKQVLTQLSIYGLSQTLIIENTLKALRLAPRAV